MSDWRPGADQAALVERAALYAGIRAFFAARDVLEVDTPLLASYGVTDPAIEPLTARGASTGPGGRYLQSSPEFAMKRLLGAGSGDIYQLGKAFRDGEAGERHNPEFTLLEWYRVGMPVADLMDEVADLVLACLPRAAGVRTAGVYSYRELFLERLAIDPFEADDDALAQLARREVDVGPLDLTRDAWLDLLLTHCIEPALAERGLVFITDYPPSQAALARTAQRGGTAVAERFELYVDGVELANGYAELTDADELVARAQRDNDHRAAAGQEQRDLDPRLVAALRAGLPACSGVALGVDRLLMLRLGARSLAEVMPFSWPRS